MPIWNERPDKKQLSGHQRIKKKEVRASQPRLQWYEYFVKSLPYLRL